jgi:MerR family mercuric resistance operon transcriptional regulator
MRTSELAERAGVNTQTLRYYERRGLLARPPRSTSGYRNYPASAVQLLRFVKRVQELGFSLDEAAELVHLAAGGPQACASARAMATARLSEIERRLADLQRMRDSLAELVATCDLPPRDRQCSLLQALQSEDIVDGVGR